MSTLRSVFTDRRRVTGPSSVFWLAVAAPRPGKCLAVAATPVRCWAVTNLEARHVTVNGLRENERPNWSRKLPGWRYTPRTGARLTLIPTPRRFSPAPRPALLAAPELL